MAADRLLQRLSGHAHRAGTPYIEAGCHWIAHSSFHSSDTKFSSIEPKLQPDSQRSVKHCNGLTV
jgi:hypothetical protein